jgi:hypothetical protein
MCTTVWPAESTSRPLLLLSLISKMLLVQPLQAKLCRTLRKFSSNFAMVNTFDWLSKHRYMSAAISFAKNVAELRITGPTRTRNRPSNVLWSALDMLCQNSFAANLWVDFLENVGIAAYYNLIGFVIHRCDVQTQNCHNSVQIIRHNGL